MAWHCFLLLLGGMFAHAFRLESTSLISARGGLQRIPEDIDRSLSSTNPSWPGEAELLLNGSFIQHTMASSHLQSSFMSNDSAAVNQTNISGPFSSGPTETSVVDVHAEHFRYDATKSHSKVDAEVEHSRATAMIEKSEVASDSLQKQIASQASAQGKLNAKSPGKQYVRTKEELLGSGFSNVAEKVLTVNGSYPFVWKHPHGVEASSAGRVTFGGTEVKYLDSVVRCSQECPYIVTIIETDPVVNGKQERGQIQEFMAGGTAESWMQKAVEHQRLSALTDFVQSVLSGLLWLRKAGFLHMDVKPDNVLLSSDQVPVWKLSDLDFLRPITEAREKLGAFYPSPSLLKVPPADQDLFAAGVTFMLFALGEECNETSHWGYTELQQRSNEVLGKNRRVRELIERLVLGPDRFPVAVEFLGWNISSFRHEALAPPLLDPKAALPTKGGLKRGGLKKAVVAEEPASPQKVPRTTGLRFGS